jgi:hypothetical protein
MPEMMPKIDHSIQEQELHLVSVFTLRQRGGIYLFIIWNGSLLVLSFRIRTLCASRKKPTQI